MEHSHIPPSRRGSSQTKPEAPLFIQRKCACGGVAGLDGGCPGCRTSILQRGAGQTRQSTEVPSIVREVLSSPGEVLSQEIGASMAARFSGVRGPVPARSADASGPAATLTTNRPGDRFEQEADRVAAQIIAEPSRTGPRDVTSSYAHTFAQVRVHRDARAAESARAIGARAYAAGHDIVFDSAAYAPETKAGQRLLAHELFHTLQQKPSSGLIMGVWDNATSKCGDAATDKWIEKVVVDQETPQKVTAFWTDGSTQSDACSSGKGHCCVDSANPSGVACTVARSHADGSNCTPITLQMGYPVKNRVLDHRGVEFWTEFVPDRAIALHKYSPVDGTPLSHGCVRMNEDMAKTIFCNVRRNQTWVQVHGFARPSCDHAALQNEWLGDFATGGQDLSQADGETAGNIRETRRELNAAFGRTLTVDEIQKLTASDIPRCSATAPLPKPTAP
jgi:hypothetical protein